MLYIEIMYILAATVALGACIPQLKQLLKAKHSDEFSIQTWVTWTCTQIVTLMYVLTIGDVIMACVNAIWLTFYACMTLLIIRYRRTSSQVLPTEAVE